MKLYQTNLSPFPTRVRLLLYAKNIAMEIVEPSGIHDAQPKGSYLDINPLGRVPALQLDDGRVLPESEVICEYLEDTFPEPSLIVQDHRFKYACRRGGSHSRNPPQKAFSLSPAREWGGSASNSLTLPPPITVSSGSSAAMKWPTTSKT